MTVAAALLFGSLARGDGAEGSDTDILLINLGEETRHVSVGHVSLFLYPWSKLLEDACNGDLFVCHLVREAKAIIDTDDCLPKMRECFQFRSNYQNDIERAADLGWYIVRFGDELNVSLQAKRALWCIRTILIARSAEQRDPVFAPSQLAARTSSAHARDLLNRRRQTHDAAVLRKCLRQFLMDEAPRDLALEHADRDSFLRKFSETRNDVALKTLRQEEGRSGYL